MQNFLEAVNDVRRRIAPVLSDKAFFSQLTRGYEKYDVNGKRVAKYCFEGNAEELYKRIDTLLCGISDRGYGALRFDKSAGDLEWLTRSVFIVLELDRAVSQEVHEFNASVGTDDGDGKNLPSYIGFGSTYLSNRFPQSFIPFDLKTYGKGKRLFHVGECKLGGCDVPEEIRKGLFDVFKQVFDGIYGKIEPKNDTIASIYVAYCAKVYALCEYLKRNVQGENVNVIALAVKIFENVEWKK